MGDLKYLEVDMRVLAGDLYCLEAHKKAEGDELRYCLVVKWGNTWGEVLKWTWCLELIIEVLGLVKVADRVV